jgi:selenocysteine lyase/cysteine desulfurase
VDKGLATMKEGGTGTISEVAVQPETLPDKYEIGSHNAIGLAGLSAGIDWLLERGVPHLRRHDEQLCEQFLAATDGAEGLTVYGPRDVLRRAGVFSVNVAGLAPGQLADALEADFGVLTRPGIHCAPLAHETIGTHPTGTCRLSFGPFTTDDDVAHAAGALVEIAQRSVVPR